MKFKENKYAYEKDFSFCSGIPTGIDFKARKANSTMYELVANGYGTKNDYGNGSLHVWGKGFEHIKKRLKKGEK